MSQIMTVDGEQIQFVLNNAEDINTEGLSDVSFPFNNQHILSFFFSTIDHLF